MKTPRRALLLVLCLLLSTPLSARSVTPETYPLEKRKAVETAIKVGNGPLDLVWTRDGRTIFLSMHRGGELVVVSDGRVVKRRAVGKNPTGVDISPDGRHLFVALAGENKILMLDAATLAVSRTLNTAAWPIGLKVAASGEFLAVACATGKKLQLFSLKSFKRFELPIGVHPFYLVITRDSNRVYVTNSGDNTLSEVTVESVGFRKGPHRLFLNETRRIKVGTYPVGLTLSADNKWVYTANFSSHTVTRVEIGGQRRVGTWKVSTNPYYLAVDPRTRALWVSHQNSPDIHLIYPNGRRTRVRLSKGGINMRFSPNGRRLAVSDYNAHLLNIVE